MRARLSMATSRKPHDERKRIASSMVSSQNFGEVVPVQLAGQAVAAREIREPALVLVALVDDAQRCRGRATACRRGRQTSGRCPRPRAWFRSPDRGGCSIESDRRRRGRSSRLSDCMTASKRACALLGFEHLRVAAAARRSLATSPIEQHFGGIGAPVQDVAVDAPVVGNFADRGEDLRRVDVAPRGVR